MHNLVDSFVCDMDVEERTEEDTQPPHKEGYEAILSEVSSILPTDFFNFDMNGYDYLRSKVIDPIQTHIPILVRHEVGRITCSHGLKLTRPSNLSVDTSQGRVLLSLFAILNFR